MLGQNEGEKKSTTGVEFHGVPPISHWPGAVWSEKLTNGYDRYHHLSLVVPAGSPGPVWLVGMHVQSCRKACSLAFSGVRVPIRKPSQGRNTVFGGLTYLGLACS